MPSKVPYCTTCGAKDPESFWATMRSRCKNCYNTWRKDQRAEKLAFLRMVKDRPCTDCGGTFHPFVMDFDHLPQFEKGFSGGMNRNLQDATWHAIVDEVVKCEVVCSNCHRMRTFERSEAVA